MNRWPFNTVSFQLLMLGIGLVLFLIIATVSIAGAASLRICYTDPLPNPDIASAPAFINGNPLAPDLLPGSTTESRCVGGPVSGEICTVPSTCQGGTCVAGRCSITPIPPTLLRGVNQDLTMRYRNTLGEEGPASDAKTFRVAPLSPKPVINSVAIVVP